MHLSVYPCCDIWNAWCWVPWKKHKLAPFTTAPWSNLLVRNINMEREASCEHVLSEAKWLGGDVTIQQMLDNGPPSPTLTHIQWSRPPEMDTYASVHVHKMHVQAYAINSVDRNRNKNTMTHQLSISLKSSLILNLHTHLWICRNRCKCTPSNLIHEILFSQFWHVFLSTSQKVMIHKQLR